jgi:hypothetical protein
MVQLGVGLHAGTALFQSVFELAGTPLANRVSRLAELAEAKTKRDQSFQDKLDMAHDIMGDLENKRLLFHREYKNLVLANGGVAIALLVALSYISFDAQEKIPWPVGLFLVTLSLLPATGSLLLLSNSWSKKMAPLRSSIEALESALLNPTGRA